jgi:hypothetical protein
MLPVDGRKGLIMTAGEIARRHFAAALTAAAAERQDADAVARAMLAQAIANMLAGAASPTCGPSFSRPPTIWIPTRTTSSCGREVGAPALDGGVDSG